MKPKAGDRVSSDNLPAWKKVGAALEAGDELTPIDGLRRFGLLHLAGTIRALKLAGMRIKSDRVIVYNRLGGECRVALYSLDKQ